MAILQIKHKGLSMTIKQLRIAISKGARTAKDLVKYTNNKGVNYAK
jgi:hypothetical protein